MILSRRVALGGVYLDEIHSGIVIQEADPGGNSENITATDRMGLWGMRVTGARFGMLEARVTFAIDLSKHQMPLRREIFDAVVAWARRKGWLTFSSLPDRRLYVDRVVIPEPGDMRDWLKDYTISFRAYNVPFWETETPTTVSRANITSGSVQIDVGGTAPGVLDIDFRNISGKTISNFAVQAGNNKITINGADIGASETLKVSHGTDGLLRITSGSRNLYGKMTGADDLIVNPGTVNVSVTATRAGALTVTSRARWM